MTSEIEIKNMLILVPDCWYLVRRQENVGFYPLRLRSSWHSNNITLRNTEDVYAFNLPLRQKFLKKGQVSHNSSQLHSSKSWNNQTKARSQKETPWVTHNKEKRLIFFVWHFMVNNRQLNKSGWVVKKWLPFWDLATQQIILYVNLIFQIIHTSWWKRIVNKFKFPIQSRCFNFWNGHSWKRKLSVLQMACRSLDVLVFPLSGIV